MWTYIISKKEHKHKGTPHFQQILLNPECEIEACHTEIIVAALWQLFPQAFEEAGEKNKNI